jgi:hypothetical protein
MPATPATLTWWEGTKDPNSGDVTFVLHGTALTAGCTATVAPTDGTGGPNTITDFTPDDAGETLTRVITQAEVPGWAKPYAHTIGGDVPQAVAAARPLPQTPWKGQHGDAAAAVGELSVTVSLASPGPDTPRLSGAVPGVMFNAAGPGGAP